MYQTNCVWPGSQSSSAAGARRCIKEAALHRACSVPGMSRVGLTVAKATVEDHWLVWKTIERSYWLGLSAGALDAPRRRDLGSTQTSTVCVRG